MKNVKSTALLVGMTGLAIFLLSAFALYPGGYSYTLHLNNRLVSEQYITPTFETPTLTLSDQDKKGTLTVYFNECGQIGRQRKLSVRVSDQKVLKEWSFANSSSQHDPLQLTLKDLSAYAHSGTMAIYYSSERVSKPQVLAYVVGATTVNKTKAASR